MTAPEAPPPSNSPRNEGPFNPKNPWAWPVMWMVVVAFLAGAGAYVFKSCRDLPGETLTKTAKLVENIGQAAQKVASAFKQGTVNTTFTSYATTLSGSQYLQFASLSQR